MIGLVFRSMYPYKGYMDVVAPMSGWQYQGEGERKVN